MPNPLILPLVIVAGVGGVGTIAWLRGRKKKSTLNGLGKKGNGDQKQIEETVPPDDVEKAKTSAQIIGPLVDTNRVASFHRPSQGDNVSAVARRSLRKVHPTVSDQQVAAMRRAIASSSYNQQVFGQPTEKNYYHPDGLTVDKAFNPKHEGAEVLDAGFLPRRNIDATGKRIGVAQKRGALWVPDVNVEALKTGVSDFAILFATAWPDGTSGMEPPPVFWEAAVAREPIQV